MTDWTIDRVKDVAQQLDLDIELITVRIDTFDEIMEWNFIGSPTVRVNGVDIDPSARGDAFGGFT